MRPTKKGKVGCCSNPSSSLLDFQSFLVSNGHLKVVAAYIAEESLTSRPGGMGKGDVVLKQKMWRFPTSHGGTPSCHPFIDS